jgi:hypothetical protein
MKKRDFDHAKERFNDRKAELHAQKIRAANLAGVPYHFGDDVKVVQEAGGITSIYFGGRGKPDGNGHAHYVLDQFGYISYHRDPGEARGPQNRR